MMHRTFSSSLPAVALLGWLTLTTPAAAQVHHHSLAPAPQPLAFKRSSVPRAFPEYQEVDGALEAPAEAQLEGPASFDLPGHAPMTPIRVERTRALPREPVETSGRLGIATDRNVGAGKAPFSSTRLIPAEAIDTYPFSTVGKIEATDSEGNTFNCSGALIAPRIVLTAGHCVHDGKGGDSGWVEDLSFAPGYHQGEQIGIWVASDIWVTNTWYSGGARDPNAADYALVILADNNLGRAGDVAGWLGVLTKKLSPNHVTMLGYPGAFDDGEWMHLTYSQSAKNGGNNTVLYGTDMTEGSSGGPWVQNFGQPAQGQQGGANDAPNRIVGVMSYGPEKPKNGLLAGSSILDQRFVDMYNEACADDPGNCP